MKLLMPLTILTLVLLTGCEKLQYEGCDEIMVGGEGQPVAVYIWNTYGRGKYKGKDQYLYLCKPLNPKNADLLTKNARPIEHNNQTLWCVYHNQIIKQIKSKSEEEQIIADWKRNPKSVVANPLSVPKYVFLFAILPCLLLALVHYSPAFLVALIPYVLVCFIVNPFGFIATLAFFLFVSFIAYFLMAWVLSGFWGINPVGLFLGAIAYVILLIMFLCS